MSTTLPAEDTKVTNLIFIDAAFPPSPATLPMTDGICFYAGGDTPHVWTVSEVTRFKVRYRLPIWVRSNPESHNASEDAQAFLKVLEGTYKVPKHKLVALDSETDVDAPWVKTFVGAVNAGGYQVIDYGSRSSVFGNHNPDGYYWAADWTGHKHLAGGSQITQYVNFSGYDESIAESTLPFWDVQAKVTDWSEVYIMSMPDVKQGDSGKWVEKVQALLVVQGRHFNSIQLKQLAIDGVAGPKTHSAIEVFQSHATLRVDGVVGENTWGRLLLS